MLKTNKTLYNDVIKKLKDDQGPVRDLTIMSDFCKSSRQKVSVCLHTADHIGNYHTHDFFEINYIQKGSCINLVEDDSILMNEGDIIIMHPGAFHNLYAEPESIVYNFLIDKKWLLSVLVALNNGNGALFKFFKNADKEDFYKYAMFPICDNKPLITKHTLAVIDTCNSDSPWKYILAETALIELLEVLSRTSTDTYLSKGRGESSHLMISMIDFITENYANVNLDILSEKFFYSKTHICRLFLKNTGKSFNQLLIDIKIGRACSLLENTDKTVNEIVDELGYDSVEYFYRLFKRNKGITPKDYRNLKQNTN